MDAITTEQAIAYINQSSVAAKQIAGINFTDDNDLYEIVSTTPVKLAAKHKEITINKVSVSTAHLPTSGAFYRNQVIESAKALGQEVEDFKVSDTFYEHTDCYPICKAKKNDTHYLYGIYVESSKPVYVMDGKQIEKTEVAEYLTKGEATKLLGAGKSDVTENKTNAISHNVKPRTTKLDNIKSISKV